MSWVDDLEARHRLTETEIEEGLQDDEQKLMKLIKYLRRHRGAGEGVK